MAYPESWKCPICSNENKETEKCDKCSFPTLWLCKKCGKEVHSSITCPNCGYNPLAPEKSKKIVKKSTWIVLGIGIYLIIMAIILIYINIQDRIEKTGELIIGQSLSFTLLTFTNPTSVTFTVLNPSGEIIYTEEAVNEGNEWSISNIIFDESGFWTVNADKYIDGEVSTTTEQFRINRECTLDEHCAMYGGSGYQEEYRCNVATGICVQHEQDIFDFLKIIMPSK